MEAIDSSAHLYACVVNNRKAYIHHPSIEKFMYRHSDGSFELYSEQMHGQNQWAPQDLVSKLLGAEDALVTEVLAFMSYNPAIGRVLEKGGVDTFRKMMRSAVKKLPKVESRGDFDEFHLKCVSDLLAKIKTFEELAAVIWTSAEANQRFFQGICGLGKKAGRSDSKEAASLSPLPARQHRDEDDQEPLSHLV